MVTNPGTRGRTHGSLRTGSRATTVAATAGLFGALLFGGCAQESSKDSGPAASRASGGSSGSSTGGVFGGARSGGSSGSSGTGGSSGGGFTNGAMATAKFCNLISEATGKDLFLTVEIGDQQKVKLVANSGECAPVKPMACPGIPAGAKVPVTMSLDGEMILKGEIPMVPEGRSLLFLAEFDDAMQVPKLGARVLKPEFKCEDLDLETLLGPPPDGGAPDGGGTTGTGGSTGTGTGGSTRPPRM